MLEKIIQGFEKVFSRRDPLAVDPDLLTLLVETRKEEQGSIIRHLKKSEDSPQKLTVKPEEIYVVYVHDPGTYKIEIAFDTNASITKKANFRKPGVYLMHPFLDTAIVGTEHNSGVAVFSRPDITVTEFNSKQSYDAIIRLFKDSITFNKTLDNYFELAGKLCKKRDSMEEDKTDYYEQIFEQNTESTAGKWYKRLAIAAVSAAATIGVLGYFEAQAEKNREKARQIEREIKDIAFENELARKIELERIRDAQIAAKRKAEEEKNRILEEENKRRNEESRKWHLEQWKEVQTRMKNDYQKAIQETYKDAEITDLAWEAYCTMPILQEKNGPNWSDTRFTVQFKDYAIKVYFHTDREYHSPNAPSITHIRTEIVKDGKTISFYQKGTVSEFEAMPESDKQAVLDLVQKHDLPEVRKNIIEAVLERGNHRASRYNGR